jgi:Zn-dependent peptidase ImmA (M78 family)/DNA-binding XRE family transcriptional regulator
MTLTPSRLALARKRRGMTLVRLATEAGITTRSLSAYESGRQQPTSATLSALADALAVPAAFLQAPEIDEIPPDAASFRAMSKMTASQRDSACSAGRIAFLINDWIEERFRLPDADIPSLLTFDPETAAEVVRARWGLGQSPVDNMIHLLESRGTRVFSLAEECAEVDAFSLYWHGTPFIFLNTMKSGERGRFDAAHELGHLVLHAGHRVPHGPDAEQEANRFAAAFLMPASSVIAARLANATTDRIIQAKHTWKVSAMALAHRLHELSLLTEWGYRTACVNLSRLGYRTSEPGGITREDSQLLSKVIKALRDDGITPAQVASGIAITTAELNSHLFGLALTVLPGGTTNTAPLRPDLHIVKPLDRPSRISPNTCRLTRFRPAGRCPAAAHGTAKRLPAWLRRRAASIRRRPRSLPSYEL